MNPLLIKRYTEGLAGALPDESEYRVVSKDLEDFLGLVKGHERLFALLSRPFLRPTKKAAVIKEILARVDYHDKSKRFLLLLVRQRRLDLLPEIIRNLPAKWKELRGIRTFDVRSVVLLSEKQKSRLEAELARLEQAPVSCSYGLDPALIGGLFIRKGNRVYDASLRGELQRLKDIIGGREPHGH
ncbi:MAG: ATP synthase F1 subunit delta [Acidobacteriota bacterium]|jgi:ATP synthase, F1 delta subunit|nr:ATP synthase F1 subunit delta [Acidobacteriota bacterium]OQB55157.1 MAG: ATP synthase subunit delta [Candidatus Aminicenantes bacterium ADurb.Bin147]HNQ81125.1 ATP synthase F1 subunit delta [Candidatus Aminicenantes bacterium]MDD8010218.1 ATP synthase F1 subunit delta [Acidobacteriota bacterium]MDD8034177.1 ATP synthase F1 subunit delta [Acidobacteriota bacterium]